MADHRARVWLTRTEHGTPYKWTFRCTCGAGGLSWSWDRQYDMLHSGLDSQTWMAENGEPTGGAFHMALDHLGISGRDPLKFVPLFG